MSYKDIQSVTGESLHEDSVEDTIPGATPFFKVDFSDDGDHLPPDQLPSNPQEYLKSVMYEARNMPSVVVAKIDPNKIQGKPRTSMIKKLDKTSIVKEEMLPTKEWQEAQIANFAISREEFVRHLAKLKSISRQTKKRPRLPIYPLPPWDDEDSWRLLCFGNSLKKRRTEVVESKTESAHEDNNSSIGEENDEPKDEEDENDVLDDALISAGRTTADILADQISAEDDERTVDLTTLEEGFPPLMRILLRMDANQVEANLEYHAKWLDEYGFGHEQGRWIYALLTCLEKPLYPSVTSCLRELSRRCKLIRSQLESPSDGHLSGLNLIICIVGRYFDQADLSDPW